MLILGIETSCDETALSLVEATGDLAAPHFRTIAATLYSQAHLHAEYGGVFPMLAKREHAKNLIPLFQELLKKAGLEQKKSTTTLADKQKSGRPPLDLAALRLSFEHEPELAEAFSSYIPHIEIPKIDRIAVTAGPGLEPALWVGINFARVLGALWNIPVAPTNHMQGHIVSPLLVRDAKDGASMDPAPVAFPAVALLISGGHTELVLMKSWREYRLLGGTKDDAVGEAFDKVARILGLPYPGGPEISRLAAKRRARTDSSDKSGAVKNFLPLPRPMLHTPDYSFSFAGLKTAVLYGTQKTVEKNVAEGDASELTEMQKEEIACEFENAAADVLSKKTSRALEEFGAQTLIVGGGVAANKYLRQELSALAEKFSGLRVLFPSSDLATDNAVMIAMASYLDALAGFSKMPLKADSNASIATQ